VKTTQNTLLVPISLVLPIVRITVSLYSLGEVVVHLSPDGGLSLLQYVATTFHSALNDDEHSSRPGGCSQITMSAHSAT
jgi:hypothetical protein